MTQKSHNFGARCCFVFFLAVCFSPQFSIRTKAEINDIHNNKRRRINDTYDDKGSLFSLLTGNRS